jgi:hypothetical protein
MQFHYLTWIAFAAWLVLQTQKTRSVASARTKLFTVSALLVIGFFMSSSLYSRAFHLPSRLPYTHPSFPLRILSSTQSVTGLIVVGEGIPHADARKDDRRTPIRYLRASHSLLGGVWIGNDIARIDGAPLTVDEQGTPLGDSIYSAFVLQEAARLVNSTSKRVQDNVLVV